MAERGSADWSRRRFLSGIGAGAAAFSLGQSGLAADRGHGAAVAPRVLSGTRFDLSIGYRDANFTGRERIATAIDGSIPGPVLRWKEGDTVTLRVTNNLAVDSSIHWHGMILPPDMDGVPDISFPGIRPGETFEYRFDVRQSGTYWYHSHSGFQEQTGMYGALVIDPLEPEPHAYDRDYAIVLSDWTDEKPEKVYAKLKKLSHYYNFRERTIVELWDDIREDGLIATSRARRMWNMQLMSDRDLADVTGYTYTFLMNGQPPATGWTGLFSRGEKVRLRFINGSAMTFFDVRIPGLKMTVVAADGQNIEPVTVEQLRMGVAETYDVIVEPDADMPYAIFASSIDRTGYAFGNLTPDPSLRAEAPPMDPAPVLTHLDMGMADHGGHDMSAGAGQQDHAGHDMHAAMGHAAEGLAPAGLAPAGEGSHAPIVHPKTERGPGVDMQADDPQMRLSDPGIGLRDNGRRVLTYGDLRSLAPTADPRDPTREIQLHLTGSMSRYMWSIDGIRYADAEPVQLVYGERVRITLVNDTMMNHPMHLHGMWSDLETGDGERIPRKHTVVVQPGSKISYLVTADAPGEWAYHCHLLYHMPGMFRMVRVT
ncbi:MAG: copper resistance system multicopper oxidase [Gammaproteobacteria bacterium]|nr:copper resistance system multicopper oxidase [Gammaproteobacteria bacterium]